MEVYRSYFDKELYGEVEKTFTQGPSARHAAYWHAENEADLNRLLTTRWTGSRSKTTRTGDHERCYTAYDRSDSSEAAGSQLVTCVFDDVRGQADRLFGLEVASDQAQPVRLPGYETLGDGPRQVRAVLGRMEPVVVDFCKRLIEAADAPRDDEWVGCGLRLAESYYAHFARLDGTAAIQK